MLEETTMLHSVLKITFASLLLIAVNIAEATIIQLASPDDFAPGASLQTFAGLPVFSQPTQIDGVGFVLDDGSGPDVAFDPNRPREFGPVEGTIIQNIVSGFLNFTISFPEPIFQVGFELRTFPGEDINLTFLSSGSVTDGFMIPTRNTTTGISAPLFFYGFEATEKFDQIYLDVQGTSGFFEMDNLRFTPEPGSLFLIAAGLVAIWILRRDFQPPRT